MCVLMNNALTFLKIQFNHELDSVLVCVDCFSDLMLFRRFILIYRPLESTFARDEHLIEVVLICVLSPEVMIRGDSNLNEISWSFH